LILNLVVETLWVQSTNNNNRKTNAQKGAASKAAQAELGVARGGRWANIGQRDREHCYLASKLEKLRVMGVTMRSSKRCMGVGPGK
jgi:hypothetical protein